MLKTSVTWNIKCVAFFSLSLLVAIPRHSGSILYAICLCGKIDVNKLVAGLSLLIQLLDKMTYSRSELNNNSGINFKSMARFFFPYSLHCIILFFCSVASFIFFFAILFLVALMSTSLNCWLIFIFPRRQFKFYCVHLTTYAESADIRFNECALYNAYEYVHYREPVRLA